MEISTRRVAELMRRNFITVSPDDSLFEAFQLMRLARVRHLPVVEEGRLVGILSHRDVLEAGSSPWEGGPLQERHNALKTLPVERVMTRSPETVTPDATLEDAAARLFGLRIGCLPVVKDGDGSPRVVGLITETDLLRAAYDPTSRWPSL